MDQNMLPFLWIAALLAFMYFMVIRPQKKQQKQRAEMLDALRKGDRILSAGGIYGIVRSIKEDRVTLEIAHDVMISMNKGAISAVLKNEGKPSKSEEPEPESIMDQDQDQDDYVVEQDSDSK